MAPCRCSDADGSCVRVCCATKKKINHRERIPPRRTRPHGLAVHTRVAGYKPLAVARNTPSMTAALNKRPTSHHAHEAHQEPERWQSPSTSRHVKESREEAGLALLLLVHQRRKLLSGRR